MAGSKTPTSKILNVRLALVNYPILADKIREKMRDELFTKKIIMPDVLEDEVVQKAVRSQEREGITDPYFQESAETWEKRIQRIRDYLTDFYFAYNLPYTRFEEIVLEAVNSNRASGETKHIGPTFNPELTPTYLLFEQAEKYKHYSPEQYAEIKHHLKQILVVLLKSLVSSQMDFVHIARNFLTIDDLKSIKDRKIGPGKVGGKSAGMLLAYKILLSPDPEDELDLSAHVVIPDTYYIGSDVYYEFKAINGLEYTTSQKYKTRAEIEQSFPQIKEDYQKGKFSDEVITLLRGMLEEIGPEPIIVRSSSLLEDNFGNAFAGKYDSFFLPNQGTLDENLTALVQAIIRVYASVLSPDALFYRQVQGLEDYDERMAILIQKVQGERHGRYFFPYIGGVGFSRNPFIWNKKLRPEEGFLRIVFGLGTRAVDRVDKDYPRMIGLSHPQLRPIKTAADIVKYSQRMVDVLDLQQNVPKSVPITTLLTDQLPGIQYLASIDEGDFIKPIYSLGTMLNPDKLVLTFENLLKNTDFVKISKGILKKLERHYNRPVDVEFTVELTPNFPKPEIKIYLLQCRPLSNQEWFSDVPIPQNVPDDEQIFTSNHLVPQGIVEKIKYIVYVDPVRYAQCPTSSMQMELARIIGKLNQKLEDEAFILMGPGRWGSSNIDLGVKVSYADIYNTRMLIEIAMEKNGATPEVSYGTHFFQDLVESKIYPLALFPNQEGSLLNLKFLKNAANNLPKLLPEYASFEDYLKVIDVPRTTRGKYLCVAMNAEENKAMGYLKKYDLSQQNPE